MFGLKERGKRNDFSDTILPSHINHEHEKSLTAESRIRGKEKRDRRQYTLIFPNKLEKYIG